ncbi:MAG: tRNA glutamyl-Q(34) synthetase GluQRS [Pseudomonadota bacterium]
MKNSTGTGTTATAESRPYRGRFAPSPTGRLHRGSLVAALASFLDARAHAGTWLIRIEDLDAARNQPGVDQSILETLASLHMSSDAPVLHQSARLEVYAAALEQLRHADLVYRCTCSRSETGGACSGRCRDQAGSTAGVPAAWRLRFAAGDTVTFQDRVLGQLQFVCSELGDPVVYRRDGVPAYQLAVVIDDAAQGITDVVRGADLVDSTAWQIRIAQALGLRIPRYAHIPLVVEPDGSKLSKSRQSLPISGLDPATTLLQSLRLLRQQPPAHLEAAPAAILEWAVRHWDLTQLAGLRTVALPA